VIPRFKPYLGSSELGALVDVRGDVRAFEEAFARHFGASDAVAFPYGRSACFALLKALGIEGAEIVLPAYTCVVVAHAIVLSGNTCRFVDVTLDDYNMDLDRLEVAITGRTAAIVPTHLFGYPVDLDRFGAIVRAAERTYGRKIFVLQDCAHSFGAHWKGRVVCGDGDAALFGLGISKLMTSIFGGMVTTGNRDLALRLRAWRDAHFAPAGILKAMLRRLYLLAVYPAFSDALFGAVRWLQDETPLLDRLAKAYHLDDQIRFPPDANDAMLDVEARVGLVQLAKYPDIVKRRIAFAHYYDRALRGTPEWVLPPIVDGATYSHYVIRVQDRGATVAAFRRHGIQLGEVIEYSVPHMRAYGPADSREFPNSWLASRHLINLPMQADLDERRLEAIVECAREVASRRAAA
jgi:dTDP-4-amino-4,6-dideoxygalactose transaminase